MLEHRLQTRCYVNGLASVRLLLPQRLATIAKLIDISPSGMAVTASIDITRNVLIKVQYERVAVQPCSIPALVIHHVGDRLGLMLDLSNIEARRQHAKLLDDCRTAVQQSTLVDHLEESSTDAGRVSDVNPVNIAGLLSISR